MRIILAVTMLSIALTSCALAQDSNPVIQAAVRAKKSQNDCFFSSAAAQLAAIPPAARKQADVNMIAEQAFQACATEEHVLATILSSAMQPSTAQIALLANRTGLKRELSAIFTNPNKYAK